MLKNFKDLRDVTLALQQQMKEANSINLSLTTFCRLMEQQQTKAAGVSTHIPYRESNLTKLLKVCCCCVYAMKVVVCRA